MLQNVKKEFNNLPKKFWVWVTVIFVTQAILLWWFGQSFFSKTGNIMLWTGTVNGPENSQQLSDWYTFSHIIHGFIFFYFLRWLFPKKPIWIWALGAMCIEVAWEILENSPIIINRYREATLGFGYSGDSILNSLMDTVWMMLGFFFARLNKWGIVLAIAVFFELLTLYFIRDNLFLNVLMLISPIEAIKNWQMLG